MSASEYYKSVWDSLTASSVYCEHADILKVGDDMYRCRCCLDKFHRNSVEYRRLILIPKLLSKFNHMTIGVPLTKEEIGLRYSLKNINHTSDEDDVNLVVRRVLKYINERSKS